MTKLSRCPCGKTPHSLVTEPHEDPWRGFAAGRCCQRWWVKFSYDFAFDSEETEAAAVKAWNRYNQRWLRRGGL